MISNPEYLRNLAKLDYIAQVKQRMISMLYFYCNARLSPVYVRQTDYDFALACIRETLDDLFHDEALAATRTKESIEQKDQLQALAEWAIRD